MFTRNMDVRQAKEQIPMWVIAERLGVSENTFIKWMRTEMEAGKKERVMNTIAEIKAEMEGVAQ